MSKYNCLDLDKIQSIVSSLASIKEAQDYILNEEVIFNPLVIKNNSIQTEEAMNIISREINVQFSGIVCIDEILSQADKGIMLDGKQLCSALVFHNNCYRIKKIFNDIEEELSIKDYTDSINVSINVFEQINKCIDNSGQIKEDASSKLKDINRSIDTLNKQLYSRAEQFVAKHSSSLQEQSIFVRENRITFLIKNSDKNKYDGYAYGSSASGLASYVEPGAFVDMNNNMLQLISDKTDEENRILKELTYLLSTVSDDYRRNFESLVKLNVVFAKANYGIKYNCIVPNYVDGNNFEFYDLCHPLIDENKVVSNTYKLYDPYQGIVISGSNTGGKTVSLKAIGLSILMSYIGIPIIASKANIPIYKNVYVDIDDNQSIQDSLSTFSAHISNINYILNNANTDCLILIDELISGTDPKEAQAISLAILDKIKELGSKFVITTHFDDIKNYSYNDEHIMLSSVGFDTNSLKPTYKYYENSIGSSNALEIASRYFDDARIIENAKNYINKSITKQEELLKKLSKEMEELDLERSKLIEDKNKYLRLNTELEKKNIEFEKEKENIKNKFIGELNEYVDDIKEKAKEKLESINDKKDKDIVKEIDDLSQKDNIVVEKVEFSIGDNVRIKDNEQVGTIIDTNGETAKIDIRGLTVKTSLSDLTLMPKTVKKEKYQEKKRYATVPKEINLVGQRVEDGLVMMEEYLDRANAARMSNVKVIHGIGSGALRSALRARMKKLSYISSFKDGDFYDGGSAVTIVEFK